LNVHKLQNQAAWKKLRYPSILPHHVPLPQSNSNAAKQMRSVIILAILAREIDKYIFQPTYLLTEDSGIRKLLVDLAMEDSNKESFCRALFQTVSPEAHSGNAERRIRKVVDNVSSYASDLLPKEQFERLLRGLDEVARTASEIGTVMQRTKEKYEPDFEPEQWGDAEWDPLSFMDPEEALVNGDGDADETLLVVFPRTCQIREKERTPCDFVTVLRKHQTIVAERELKKKPSSPTPGRGVSGRTRSRRMSISVRPGD
jgi:hypothetical protein